MHEDSEVSQSGVAREQQAMPGARLMDLDAEEILLRLFTCELDKRFAIAETDFQHALCAA